MLIHSGLWVVVSIILFGILVFSNLQARARLTKERNIGNKRVKFLGAALVGRDDHGR